MKQSLLFILVLLFYNCSLTDNESYNPAWLVLENPKLITDESKQGAATFDLKDAWVYIDGQLLGVFRLPARVPVITDGGSTEIRIAMGIKENGDNDSSFEYPFFNPINSKINLEAGKDFKIPLNVTYTNNAVFDVIEGFEGLNHSFTYDADANVFTKFSFTSIDKASGLKSGIITLDKENNQVELGTGAFYDNSFNKKGAVFFEFDYKIDEDVLIGYEVEDKSNIITEYKVILLKSDKWKHAYINLSKEISNVNVLKYRPMIQATYKGSNTISNLYFDNLKLVHF
jgi:hypothetical protein